MPQAPTDSFDLNGRTVLLTGGTGSFGNAFVERVLASYPDTVVRILSRDEFKQSEMRKRLADDRLRFLVGDVRDRDRLHRAAHGVDVIVHAAAMKQVPACEYNPLEAVKTNINGAQNVVDVAIDTGVPRMIGLSTDKAVNPVNLYGATKLCAEKIIVQGNAYAAATGTHLACVRYGNVVGSRGSVLPLFREQAKTGRLTITDERMTRFWITLDQSVQLVIDALDRMRGGEVFVPKIPSMRVVDLAAAVAPGVPYDVVGIRPGEKLHEVLITSDESRHAVDMGDTYVVLPELVSWPHEPLPGGHPLETGFEFRSDRNERWLDQSDLAQLLS